MTDNINDKLEQDDIFMSFPLISCLATDKDQTIYELMLASLLPSNNRTLQYGYVITKLSHKAGEWDYKKWEELIAETMEKQDEILGYFNQKGQILTVGKLIKALYIEIKRDKNGV